MNVRLEMKVIEDSVDVYNRSIERMEEILQSIEKLKDGMTKEVWEGKGRTAFDQALVEWIIRTKYVVLEMEQTRNSLVYAGNKGNEMRKTSEGFGGFGESYTV